MPVTWQKRVDLYFEENSKYLCHCENPIPITYYVDLKFENRFSGRGVMSGNKCVRCSKIFIED